MSQQHSDPNHYNNNNINLLHQDTSIVHDVFGTDETTSSISERDQQIVIAQLQNLVMALRTNAKFRSSNKYYSTNQQQYHNQEQQLSSFDRTLSQTSTDDVSSLSAHSPMTPSSALDGMLSPNSITIPPVAAVASSSNNNNNDTVSFTTSNYNNAAVYQQSSSTPPSSSSLRQSFHASNQHPLVHSALSLRYRLLRPLAGPLSTSSRRCLANEQVLLEPFLQVMSSSETTEPISAVAMVAVITFLDLQCQFITAQSIIRICETARVTRGEVMDVQSHDAFLARIIQVFVAAFRHPAAAHVTEELPVRVFESIMKIGNEAQSELLRRVSEQGMNDIVSACYTHSIVPQNYNDPAAARFASLLRLICKIITCDVSIAHILGLAVVNVGENSGSGGNSGGNSKSGSSHQQSVPASGSVAVASGTRNPLAVQLQGLVLAHTALLVLRHHIALDPFKSVLYVVRNELTRALLRVGKHSDHIVVLAQVLRTMHLLFSFASIHLVPQLVSFLQFILKRGQVVSGSSMASPQRMDSTTEFTTLNNNHGNNNHNNANHSRSNSGTTFSFTTNANNNSSGSKIAPRPRLEEIQVESLWEFCGHESFPAFLIHHVDLSLDNNAVFGGLCWFLAETCIPENAHALNHVNVLPLDCLLVLLNHISARIGRVKLSSSSSSSSSSISSPPSHLVQKQQLKQLLEKFIVAFKEDSAKSAMRAVFNTWTEDERAAFNLPRASSQLHGVKVGQFLFKYRLRLDAKNLVDYVGEVGKGAPYPEETSDKKTIEDRKQWLVDTEIEVCKLDSCRYHHEIRGGFIGSQPFRGKPLLLCLREFCFGFRVSGEAQKIDRIMEEFSIQWFTSNRDAPKEINPFIGKDAPFILAFSIIMLNTDLHIANLPKKMTRDEFIRRNRGLDEGGADLPATFLGGLFDEVKSQQIVFVDMLNGNMKNSKLNDCDLDFTWHKEVEDAAGVAASLGSDLSRIVSFQTKDDAALLPYDSFVLREFWRPCSETFLKILHIAALSLPSLQQQHHHHGSSSSSSGNNNNNLQKNSTTTTATTTTKSASSYTSLRESLSYLEQTATMPSVEMLESVNRGLQALALTGNRMGIHEVSDFIVNCILDFVPIDLTASPSLSPFQQMLDLGNKVSPLLSLDTLFRGFLVDVVDSLQPESFMRLARCLVSLLLCGAFDNSTSSPNTLKKFVCSDLLLKPSVIAAPPQLPTQKQIAAAAAAAEQAKKQQQQQGGGGWFSFFGGGGGGNSNNNNNNDDSTNNNTSDLSINISNGNYVLTPVQQERAKNGGYTVDEGNALARLRSALPSLRELFSAIDRFSSDSIKSLLSSLVAVIDEGSLVAPQWKDELVSVGAAFVVEILIQCPSLSSSSSSSSSSSNKNQQSSSSNTENSSSSVETLVRYFLEEQLDSASRTASSNIVKSILRYAQFYEKQQNNNNSNNNTNSSSTAARVLKLVSCVQCLPPPAFSPIVKDILITIDHQLQDPVASAKGIEEVVWVAILRILKHAGRCVVVVSNNNNNNDEENNNSNINKNVNSSLSLEESQRHQQSQQSQHSESSSYQPKYHALAILGRIVRSRAVPLSLCTDLAETVTSFALLDIPLTRTTSIVTSSSQQQQQQQQNQSANQSSTSFASGFFAPLLSQQQSASAISSSSPPPSGNTTVANSRQESGSNFGSSSTINSPTTTTNSTKPTSANTKSSSTYYYYNNHNTVRDDDLPIPILTNIHERLVEGFSATAITGANSNNNNNNSIASPEESMDYWLKFVVAITMGLVAAAEHASNHSAMELLNALSVLVVSTAASDIPGSTNRSNVTLLLPSKAIQLLETVLLPVVDRVFITSNNEHSNSNQNQQQQLDETALDLNSTNNNNNNNNSKRKLSMFSPTDLLTYMLGPLAGPDSSNASPARSNNNIQNNSNQNQHNASSSKPRHGRCSDEVKAGLLRLIASTSMHYFETLAASHKQFLPLWNRVLASYYAIYTRQQQQQNQNQNNNTNTNCESEDVKEAVQYTVLNLIRVVVTTTNTGSRSAGGSGNGGGVAAVFAMHPQFWKQTREMLRRFDFAVGLDQELESLGYC